MLTAFRVVFGALVAIKILQLTARASLATDGGISLSGQAATALPLGAALLVVVVLFVLNKYPRWAAAGMLAGFLTFIFGFGFYNHHTYLIVVICAIFVVGVSVPHLLRVQLTLVYAFAVITKLNETYLSGSELYASMVQHSAWQAAVGVDPAPAFLISVAAASIVVEAFLAVGLWFARTRRAALVVGVCFHVGLVVAVTDSVDQCVNLVVYGGLMLALYIPFFHEEIDARLGRDRAPTAREPSVA